MTSIITGDIINSRKSEPKIWVNTLKKALNAFGETPIYWEIYRGDSFQLEVKPENALQAALQIKAAIKELNTIDVRMAIGVGEKTFDAGKITESNGSAFVNSGECFENLKKNTLAIKTDSEAFNSTINTMLQLATLTINNWKPTTAQIFKTTLENPSLNQKEIAGLLDKTQSNISSGLNRSGYDELTQLIAYYKKHVTAL